MGLGYFTWYVLVRKFGNILVAVSFSATPLGYKKTALVESG